MYCNCSNKNNYEVISLCNIKKFTEKYGPFNNKAWVQISIADVLVLDCNKLAIEKIEKIYIDVSITSTKIIETPISPDTNSEGMILTGKKLLIDGFICSKIVYTSLTKEQSVYTSNFLIPFCTYIVIEANADQFNDVYCIRTCIEDVFLSLIDCKTIFQNVTLFLFAEKTSITCPSPQIPKDDCTIKITPIPPPPPPKPTKLQNAIIINNINDSLVSKVEFDIINKKFIVTSTNNNSNNRTTTGNYFSITLRPSSRNRIKGIFTITNNTDGTNFKNSLNEFNFEFDDIIDLNSLNPAKITITNYPATPQNHILTTNNESYIITPNGLVQYFPLPILPPGPATIPTEIIVGAEPNGNVAVITFDASNKILKVIAPSGVKSNPVLPPTDEFFSFKLKDFITQTTKVSSSILGDSTGNNFANALNNVNFEFNDFIELTFTSPSRSLLFNFPRNGERHTPTNTKEFYRITTNNLVPFIPPTPPIHVVKTPNAIIIKNNNDAEVARIEFYITSQSFLVTSTGVIANATSGNIPYFTLKLLDITTQRELLNTQILSNENADRFVNSLNNKNFILRENFLELTYQIPSKITISNFPNQNQTHIPTTNTERYRITSAGLVTHP